MFAFLFWNFTISVLLYHHLAVTSIGAPKVLGHVAACLPVCEHVSFPLEMWGCEQQGKWMHWCVSPCVSTFYLLLLAVPNIGCSASTPPTTTDLRCSQYDNLLACIIASKGVAAVVLTKSWDQAVYPEFKRAGNYFALACTLCPINWI